MHIVNSFAIKTNLVGLYAIFPQITIWTASCSIWGKQQGSTEARSGQQGFANQDFKLSCLSLSFRPLSCFDANTRRPLKSSRRTIEMPQDRLREGGLEYFLASLGQPGGQDPSQRCLWYLERQPEKTWNFFQSRKCTLVMDDLNQLVPDAKWCYAIENSIGEESFVKIPTTLVELKKMQKTAAQGLRRCFKIRLHRWSAPGMFGDVWETPGSVKWRS